MSTPSVTVVVCAYTSDRWSDLVAAVESVRSQTPTADEVLLVIDHHEDLLTRARRELADDHGALPVRVLANTAARGLSGARNTAVAAARGDIVVFLDDDAAAEPGWLATLLAPYADPQVRAVGGAAVPRWPVDRPRTLPAGVQDRHGELDWVVGCTYTGQPTAPAQVRNLMGCNMSFRRDVFDQVGGFAVDLGRIGRTPLGCEETELCIRLGQAAPEARIVFRPDALVRHRVTPDRTTWRYLLRRSWAEGVSKAAVSRMVGASDGLSTERSYVATVLPRALWREVRGTLRSGRRAASAVALMAAPAATAAGYVRGRLHPTKEPSR